MPFSLLGLSPALLKTLAELQFTVPHPIQKEAIPAILKGKDILGIAQTGSGKTASYVLPILEQFQRHAFTLKNRQIKTLVLVPTRELAEQINTVFTSMSANLPVKVKNLAVYGGVSINPQMIALQGTAILVATPGRLLELLSEKALSLADVQTLVLDEADKMLNPDFQEELNKIISLIPRKRQTLLFSATLSEDLSTIQQNILHQPLIIKAEEETVNLDLIEQSAYIVSEEKKGPLLRYLIKNLNIQQVLVFTSSVQRADAVVLKLNNNKIDSLAMHSKMSQGARTNALNQFKSGKVRVLVATDLLARGIDIPSLPYVINYELPRSPKDYVHRIGRTGRAGSQGKAVSLVTPAEEHHFYIIQKKMGKRVLKLDGNALV